MLKTKSKKQTLTSPTKSEERGCGWVGLAFISKKYASSFRPGRNNHIRQVEQIKCYMYNN